MHCAGGQVRERRKGGPRVLYWESTIAAPREGSTYVERPSSDRYVRPQCWVDRLEVGDASVQLNIGWGRRDCIDIMSGFNDNLRVFVTDCVALRIDPGSNGSMG